MHRFPDPGQGESLRYHQLVVYRLSELKLPFKEWMVNYLSPVVSILLFIFQTPNNQIFILFTDLDLWIKIDPLFYSFFN